jgi:Flp pilus assembly pilin Flp
MTDAILGAVVRAQNAWMRLHDEERGQGLVEYALIIAVVALGVILAIVFLRDQISGLFNKAGSELSTQPS